MAEKKELINYTLRLPEEYRRRLELEAKARGRSLNQQIIRILEIYFAASGYASELISSAGQMFQVQAALAHDTSSETVWEFSLENFKTGKEEAHYLIGVDRTFNRDLKIADKVQAAKEVGLALLNLHVQKGRDIRALSWTQNPAFDGKRVIFRSELPDEIETLPDFVELMAKGQWQDGFLVPDEEMEAMKTLVLVARLEQSPIVKHLKDPDSMWVQVGSKKFDSTDASVYVKALAKLDLLRLVELQVKQEPTINTYGLTPEAVQFLAKLAFLG